MKKTILTLLAAAFCCVLTAQQTIKSEDTGAFNSISLTGNLQVELVESDKNAIDIKLYDADIKHLKWSVGKDGLSVTLRPLQAGKGYAEVVIQYADTIKSVSVNSGTLSFSEPIMAKMLKLSISGGGKLSGEVETMDLELEVTGNSAAELKGRSKYISLRTTEKSKVDIRGIDCIAMEAETATGAEAYVTATERLIANAKTSSTIFYRGAPTIVKDVSSKFSNTVGSSVLNID